MEKNIVNHNQNKKNQVLSIWVLVGAVLVLSPIFAYITMDSINRQKENNIKLLVEKGSALIRSFEAGTRAGIFGYGETKQLQRLLYETAKQPDIKYLLVANTRGKIIAHSNLSHTGERLNLMLQGKRLDLSKIADSSDLYWHIVETKGKEPYFLLFRKFSPSGGGTTLGIKISKFSSAINNRGIIDIITPERIVVAAFDLKSINNLEKIHIRSAVISGVGLFLAGITGVLFLFILQGYRSTRTSLSNIRVFSSTLVENLPVGLIALDQKYRIVLTNNIAKSILLIEDTIEMNAVADKYIPEALLEKIKALNEGRSLIEENVDCRLSSGHTVPLDISLSTLKDHEGKPSGFICLFKDVSEVRELKYEIERSRRLASVGKLAAGVAHEVRNPLSSIKGFATYFKERYTKVAEDQQISDIMIQEVDRLNLVVGQLLEFARPVKLSVRQVELKPFFLNSLKLVEIRAENGEIVVKSNLPDDNTLFHFDPDKISQVLLNLYINAIDAMDSGGTLSVNVSLEKEEKQLRIQISDDGHGINEDDKAYLFDPYFTTKSSGTGLGLAISYNIIERHKGEFIIESHKGEGTVAKICLPEQIKGKNE